MRCLVRCVNRELLLRTPWEQPLPRQQNLNINVSGSGEVISPAGLRHRWQSHIGPFIGNSHLKQMWIGTGDSGLFGEALESVLCVPTSSALNETAQTCSVLQHLPVCSLCTVTWMTWTQETTLHKWELFLDLNFRDQMPAQHYSVGEYEQILDSIFSLYHNMPDAKP